MTHRLHWLAAALVALVLVACGAPASPATLDRLRGYGFVGAGGESVEELENRSRSSHLPAADESPAAVVEADGLLRAILPLVLDRFDDPRAPTLATRLRALPPQRTWDDVQHVVDSLGTALEVWEPDLPPGELARFSPDANVARAAAPISARTAVVLSIQSITHWIARTREPAAPAGATEVAGQSLCPATIADLAIQLGAPAPAVRDAVHAVVRDVRVADVRPASSATPPPPCTPTP